jgi:hypothetical protein
MKYEKHCITCTCGQRSLRPNSLFIKQQINSESISQNPEALETVLKLMGHSDATIHQVMEDFELSPKTSKTSESKRCSLESIREEQYGKCDYCKRKRPEIPQVEPPFVTVDINLIPANPTDQDAVHISPVPSERKPNKNCWSKWFCRV